MQKAMRKKDMVSKTLSWIEKNFEAKYNYLLMKQTKKYREASKKGENEEKSESSDSWSESVTILKNKNNNIEEEKKKSRTEV